MRPAGNLLPHQSRKKPGYLCDWKLPAGVLASILLLVGCLYFSLRFRLEMYGQQSGDNALQQLNASLSESSKLLMANGIGSSVSVSRGEEPTADQGTPPPHVASYTPAAGPFTATGDLAAVADPFNASERHFPFPPEAKGLGDPFFTICAIVRSETDLREWAHHYVRHFNLSRIYIYDHGSKPPVHQVLADYIRAGRVTVILWPPKKKPPRRYKKSVHMHAYTDCLRRTKIKKYRHEWVAFFDADEYLWLHPTWQARGIGPFLKQYAYAGALGVQWLYHGNDGRVKRPKEGVRKSYVSCLHDTWHHIKSIVHIPFGAQPVNPHYFRLTKQRVAVTETHEVVPGPFATTASLVNISLHHYVIRSEEDFTKKLAKGGVLGSLKDWEFFGIIANSTVERCAELVDWD